MVVKQIINLAIVFGMIILFGNLILANIDSPIKLSLEKENYVSGDNLLAIAELSNLESNGVNYFLETIISNEERSYPVAPLLFEGYLKPEETSEVVIYDFEIEGEMNPGDYFIKFRLLFDERIIQEGEVEFSVTGTLKEFYFEIDLDKKVFVQNENIYLDYTSSIESPIIFSTLIYSDKTTEQIILPTTILAEQIGTYEIEVIASKEGYKTIIKKEQFAVIEEEAEIKLVSVCNVNGNCDQGETSQNCPQDCLEIENLLGEEGSLVDDSPLVEVQLGDEDSLDKESSFWDKDSLKSFFSFDKENSRLYILYGSLAFLLIIIIIYWIKKE